VKVSPVDTPLMQQYRDIKAKHSNAIVFFRMGDFYEMFEADAKLAARELGLTLTTRNNGGASEVPLAGVPVKAAAEYVRRLLANGHRVAICEQVEDPKLAKGLVRREVVETLTPGAVVTEEWLDRARNNFLIAMNPAAATWGVAAIDLSTGEFELETVAAEELGSTLARYDAAELVVPTGTSGLPVVEVLRTERDAWEFDASIAQSDLERRFDLATLDGLGIEPDDAPALGAAGALLRYLAELRPQGLPHLSRPRVRRPGHLMSLDEMTRRNLELVEPLRRERAETTLLNVLDRTVTPMGARLLRRWVLEPLLDISTINRRLDAVEVLVRDSMSAGRLREALDGVRDLERLASRAALGRATPRELGSLRDSVRRLPDVREALDGFARRESSAAIEADARDLDLLTDISAELGAALVDRPPAVLGDGDTVQRGYDAELDDLTELRDGGKRYIATLQARERGRTGIGSLKVGFNKVFGYYIEVTRANLGSVPTDYERRQTLTGAERFVTPELKEYEAKVLGAEDRIAVREREVVEALRRFIGERIGRVQTTAGILARLDVWAGLAEVARFERYTRPELDDSFTLDLKASRHPSLERLMPRESFIPNDVYLDEQQRVMVITGPNMAGKSTILRQVGLCTILAQIGSFVPAARARIGVVDRLYTRVGASDDLARGQSTFMVEMAETSAILHGASARSLVLLDEIGRGTSTYDGVAIAWAVTEHLHGSIGCKALFATHYHELVQVTEELAHARNFNVAVRDVNGKIVFLHRLEPGGTDRSYGIHVAELAGLPSAVVGRARELLLLLEAGHHVAGQRVPAPDPSVQFSLFAAASHPVVAALKQLDIEALTPLEALNRLAEFKREAT